MKTVQFPHSYSKAHDVFEALEKSEKEALANRLAADSYARTIVRAAGRVFTFDNKNEVRILAPLLTPPPM